MPAAAPIVRGMPGLLLVVALGVPLPLGLLADGEWWEEKLLDANVVASEVVYDQFRRLDLTEHVLLAKPANPEIIAQFREGDPGKVKEALKQVERVKLNRRSLRGASFKHALLPGADLREAQLQGANLYDAKLQYADLTKAQLQGANLYDAKLQYADLTEAQLQGANFWMPLMSDKMTAAKRVQYIAVSQIQLQGADLTRAHLQGADLLSAQLQGADLAGAELQGADLRQAELQGADLRGAHLQGADLAGAELRGADLRRAHLHGAALSLAQFKGADLAGAELYGAIDWNGETALEKVRDASALVEVRGASWTPLTEERLAKMRDVLNKTIGDADRRKKALERIERAGKEGLPPPILESCLIDSNVTPQLNCKKKWLPGQIDAFRSKLFPALEKLACQSSEIARGLIRQIELSEKHDGKPREKTDGRFGLAGHFTAQLDDPDCKGLSALPEAYMIRDLAKREEELRGQKTIPVRP